MNRDKATLVKYLNIKENEIYTKFPCIIRISTEEYKFSDNDLLDEEEFQLQAGEESSFNIPGTIEIEFPEQGETVNLFLPYNINLIKPDEFEVSSKGMVFSYEEGDLIINAYTKLIETNIGMVDSLFENRVKYLRGFVGEQVEAIWSQISNTANYRSHHIMLVLSLLYAKMDKDAEGNNIGPVLIRHTPLQDYKKEYAINTKETSHFFSMGAQATNYGYTNDALFESATKDRKNNLYQDGISLEAMYPDVLNSTIQLPKPNKLLQKFNKDKQKLIPEMVKQYSDLENIMAGRYDELAAKKNKSF